MAKQISDEVLMEISGAGEPSSVLEGSDGDTSEPGQIERGRVGPGPVRPEVSGVGGGGGMQELN